MTEENTTPDTAYQEALDRTCSNWTVPANWDQSRCSLDGSPCGTKDCPHNSPHTGHNAPTPTCCDECDNDCTHDGDPAPKVSPTPEEIDAAWEHLRSLIARADFPAAAFSAFACGEGNQVTSVCSPSLLLPDDINFPGPSLLWIATLGGLDLAHKSLKGCKQSIKDGIAQYLDARWEKKQATDLYTILRGIAEAKSPAEDHGEQVHTDPRRNIG